jgi:hypothetical protein
VIICSPESPQRKSKSLLTFEYLQSVFVTITSRWDHRFSEALICRALFRPPNRPSHGAACGVSKKRQLPNSTSMDKRT